MCGCMVESLGMRKHMKIENEKEIYDPPAQKKAVGMCTIMSMESGIKHDIAKKMVVKNKMCLFGLLFGLWYNGVNTQTRKPSVKGTTDGVGGHIRQKGESNGYGGSKLFSNLGIVYKMCVPTAFQTGQCAVVNISLLSLSP